MMLLFNGRFAKVTPTGMKREWQSSVKRQKIKSWKQVMSFITWLLRLSSSLSMTTLSLIFSILTKICGPPLGIAGKMHRLTFKEGLTLPGMERIHPSFLSTMLTLHHCNLNLDQFLKLGIRISNTKVHGTNQTILNRLIEISCQNFKNNVEIYQDIIISKVLDY